MSIVFVMIGGMVFFVAWVIYEVGILWAIYPHRLGQQIPECYFLALHRLDAQHLARQALRGLRRPQFQLPRRTRNSIAAQAGGRGDYQDRGKMSA